mmetsp:Transcript_12058/g.16863  ORF Transcript_12058/g.16863 Transcript_12058/m.16863 type:complete len:218 (+) Transcript_12058:136-789(+)
MSGFAASIKNNKRYENKALGLKTEKKGLKKKEKESAMPNSKAKKNPLNVVSSVPSKYPHRSSGAKMTRRFSTITESTEECDCSDDESSPVSQPVSSSPTLRSNSSVANKCEWSAQWEKSTSAKSVKDIRSNTKNCSTADQIDFETCLYTIPKTLTLTDIDMDALVEGNNRSVESFSRSAKATSKAQLRVSSSSSFASQARSTRSKKSINAFAAWTAR